MFRDMYNLVIRKGTRNNVTNAVIYMMDDNCRVSEAMYVGLCRYIGTPTEVTIRREVIDMGEVLHKHVLLSSKSRMMFSGSFREGFRLKSSDREFMHWPIDLKVITDITQTRM